MPSVGTRPIAGCPSFPWTTIGLMAAGAGVMLAAVAVARRRRREGASGGEIEIAAATVAILGGLAALAGQFYGVGHKERPPPQALATVREVYARIPLGEYLEAMRVPAQHLDEADRRELGNVVWLQIDLTGYGDARRVTLDYASYGAESGSGELPATRGAARLDLERRDHQKQFYPVWVGLPTVRYQVQFRILDPRTDAVQAMTSTGAMRGEKHRYVCKPPLGGTGAGDEVQAVQRIGIAVRPGRLQLQDDAAVAAMGSGMEHAVTRTATEVQPLQHQGALVRHPGLEARQHGGFRHRQQLAQEVADNLLHGAAEECGTVGAGLQHRQPPRAQRQERAIWLDAARDVDRLAVAGRQSGRIDGHRGRCPHDHSALAVSTWGAIAQPAPQRNCATCGSAAGNHLRGVGIQPRGRYSAALSVPA